MRVAFHKNNGNHENDENGSESYKEEGWVLISGRSFILLALQKMFVNICFVSAWEFGIEKRAGIFGEFFLVSVSWETKHENSSKKSGKIRSKIRQEIRDKNSKKSGNFRSATFLI